MTISAALEEAYAAADVVGDIWDTIEIDHPTLAEPLRFVRGAAVKDVFETMAFPVVFGGPNVTFTVVDFSFTRPGFEEGGQSKAKIRVDNISRILQGALRAAIASDQPFAITYRAYHSEDIPNPEIYSGLRMGAVSVSALSATGDLYYEEIEMKAFPAKTFNLTDYPALYGQS